MPKTRVCYVPRDRMQYRRAAMAQLGYRLVSVIRPTGDYRGIYAILTFAWGLK